MNNSFIIQMGIANPAFRLSQEQVAEYLAKKLDFDERKTKKLVRLYKKTAIQYRYTVLDPDDDSLVTPLSSTAVRMKIYEAHALNLAMAAINQGINPALFS